VPGNFILLGGKDLHPTRHEWLLNSFGSFGKLIIATFCHASRDAKLLAITLREGAQWGTDY
jgi:hypothetical protein